MLLKIIAVAVATIITNSIIKQYRQDIALLINISGGLIILFLVAGEFNSLLGEVVGLQAATNITSTVLPIVKVVGIGYITEFCADLAEDAGNKTISSKILLGGKIAICAVALPMVKNMLSVILSLL